MKGPGVERSGAKWRSGEGLLLARGLCSFGFLPVASDEGEGDGPQPRNINTLNSLSTPAGLGHMLTSHNYGFTTFVHREGELSCVRERERERLVYRVSDFRRDQPFPSSDPRKRSLRSLVKTRRE